MFGWEAIGEVANVDQLPGTDAVGLISLIAKAASTVRIHKKNCRQFAQHLKLVGNLLEQLKISELKKYPVTWEPLEQLEEALRTSYILINSFQDRSYLYLLASGWSIVYQFRSAQDEIDRYLLRVLVPLITRVNNARVMASLEDIEKDHQREYTLDEEDRRIQEVILKPDTSKNDAKVLKKTLSFPYPNLPFNEALQKENEKLQAELELSQANLDVGQCEVIKGLIDLTESVAGKSFREKNDYRVTSRNTLSVTSRSDLPSRLGLGHHEDWDTNFSFSGSFGGLGHHEEWPADYSPGLVYR